MTAHLFIYTVSLEVELLHKGIITEAGLSIIISVENNSTVALASDFTWTRLSVTVYFEAFIALAPVATINVLTGMLAVSVVVFTLVYV